jgi:predicted nuclease of predicted toxin-antitoxin system
MSLTFLLDENLPFALIEWLTQRGFEAKHLKMLGKGGIKNGEVYQLAETEHAWILTRDADFKSYEKFIRRHVPGIIVFQLSDTRTSNIIATMKQFLDKHADQFSARRLIIIEDSQIKFYEP